MKPRHWMTFCCLVGSALALGEGSYSNAPAASGHDTAPAAGRTTNNRVPVGAATGKRQANPSFYTKPESSDAAPFGAQPDLNKELESAISDTPRGAKPDSDLDSVIDTRPPAAAISAPAVSKMPVQAPARAAQQPVRPAPQPAVRAAQQPARNLPLQPPPLKPQPAQQAIVPQPTEEQVGPITAPPIAPAIANEPPAQRFVAAPPQLVDAFSVEQNPGQGTLDYTHGGQTEHIDFGTAAGHFAMGMIFRGEFLPDQLGPEFKQKNLFQIALGTLRQRLQGQTPQFGSLSLLTDGMVEYSARYMLRMPTGQNAKPETGGLMLFTSPNTPVEQSDEEKLKSTYFAQAGTLNLTPEGKPRLIDIKAQGRHLTYRMQLMKLEINGKLITPFNATEASLSGTIEFPIYYSEDRAGDVLAKQIARESFGNAATITVMDDPNDPRREVASQKKAKKSKPRKRARRDDEDDG